MLLIGAVALFTLYILVLIADSDSTNVEPQIIYVMTSPIQPQSSIVDTFLAIIAGAVGAGLVLFLLMVLYA